MREEKNVGFKFLGLAVVVFLGFFAEIILVPIEQKIYGLEMNAWLNTKYMLIHWSIISIVWILYGFAVIKFAKEKLKFDIMEIKRPIEFYKKIAILISFIFILLVSYYSWDGFKILKEFQMKGLIGFIFQHIYYFAETILFTLIIIFGQTAFEKFFKNDVIPYGGIICAFTWGIIHILTKSSFYAGIVGVLWGLIFGSVYLLVNKDAKKTFLLLFIFFIV